MSCNTSNHKSMSVSLIGFFYGVLPVSFYNTYASTSKIFFFLLWCTPYDFYNTLTDTLKII